MTVNNTCVNGKVNDTCAAPSPPVGLAVGLTVFFLLVIVVGVIVYIYRNKIRNTLQFEHRRSQKKEDYTETPYVDSHQYTSRSTEQSIGQTPIYENLTTRTTGYNRPAVNQSRSPSEPEEDLYLQCDLPDDAIYNNDPACNLSIQEEEDVYVVPDS